MLILGILLIVLGLIIGSWAGKNEFSPPGYRARIFETRLGGCIMLFIPFVLIVIGIYILITL